MYIIQQITSAPLQQMTLVLPDGTSMSMTLYFAPMQYAWVITNLTYNTFILNGLRVTTSPNMLNQFINQIPFGLACFTVNNREPMLQQDFSSGNSQLFILSQAECQQYETLLNGPSIT